MNIKIERASVQRLLNGSANQRYAEIPVRVVTIKGVKLSKR